MYFFDNNIIIWHFLSTWKYLNVFNVALQVFYVKTYFRRKIRLDVEALEIEDEAEMNIKVSFWLLFSSKFWKSHFIV